MLMDLNQEMSAIFVDRHNPCELNSSLATANVSFVSTVIYLANTDL